MPKILIIEDDPDIAGIERDYLEVENCTVDIAADGVTGVQKGLKRRLRPHPAGSDAAGHGRLFRVPEAARGAGHSHSDGDGAAGGHRQNPRAGPGRGRLH
jgi:hypothetical protein